ncbi:MAG: glycosyltransferase family 9 protein [Saprospiraceae bacterium]
MKILLLRFSSIGDIVLTTPVVRCLKKQLGAELHYLSKTSFSPILEANPYLDKVFSFQKEIPAELVRRLRVERYDYIIDLHHNLRSLCLKLLLGRPSRAFDKLNWEKWLLVNFKIDRLPNIHIVHRYMATVKHLGVEYDGNGLDYFIPEDENLESQQLPNQPFVAFVLGATHATKRLPEQKIIEICRQINHPIVLLGGKLEKNAADQIAQAAGTHVYNLCGLLSLHQSACVIRLSNKIITHDTGLMHIAAALRKPIVSVWGSTVPKFGMWPFYPTGMDLNTSVEISGLSCRPCSKIGFEKCPKGHFKCMKEIDAQRISNSL